MSRRKKLHDLEYMMPRELREEAEREEEVEEEEEGVFEAQSNICYKCSKTSDEAPLFPVFYRSTNDLICPKCFKKLMDESDDVPPPMSMFG